MLSLGDRRCLTEEMGDAYLRRIGMLNLGDGRCYYPVTLTVHPSVCMYVRPLQSCIAKDLSLLLGAQLLQQSYLYRLLLSVSQLYQERIILLEARIRFRFLWHFAYSLYDNIYIDRLHLHAPIGALAFTHSCEFHSWGGTADKSSNKSRNTKAARKFKNCW